MTNNLHKRHRLAGEEKVINYSVINKRHILLVGYGSSIGITAMAKLTMAQT